jgi:hypothetical protein
MGHRKPQRAGRFLATAIAVVAVALALLIDSPVGGRPGIARGGPAATAAPAGAQLTSTPTPTLQYFPFAARDTLLVKPGWATASAILTVKIDPYIGVGSDASLCPLSFDGSVNTPDKTLSGYTGFDFYDNDKWLYVGGAVPFTKIQVWAEVLPGGYGGGTWGQGNPNGPSAQYFNGTAWVGFSVDSDTTVVAGNSFARNGQISFSLSGGPMVQTTQAGIKAYYIRGRFNASADRIHIPEVQPWGWVPMN